jgi:hypothetical protein
LVANTNDFALTVRPPGRMKKVLPALLDPGHGCVFVNLCAGVLRRLEHVHQFHGMDVSAVGVEEPSLVDLGADRANESLLIPELVIVFIVRAL